jgi:polyisoprenoid-binding protein YceI
MKRLLVIVPCLLVLAGVVPQPTVYAAAPAWEFDRAHAAFYFDVKHIFSTVRGLFEDYSGTFRFDPNQLEESGFDITVKVKSVNTFNTKRDNHLRSNDFFDAGKFPEMKFQSRRITHTGGSQYAVQGTLTIKDVSKDITVPFTFWGVKENPFNPKELVAGFDARFTIDRIEYHVGDRKYYDMGVTGKDIDLFISLEMIRSK